MKTYDVSVDRIAYATRTITVQAENEEQARMKAEDQAGDFFFSEHSSKYEAWDCMEVSN